MNTQRKTVVITGAHSPLGRRILAEFTTASKYMVYGFVTPWAELPESHSNSPFLKFISADLTKPLEAGINEIIGQAEAIFHFAWLRGDDETAVLSANEAIIHHIMAPLRNKSRFYFMSSVAASPGAMSIYGQTKFRASTVVRATGGTVLVLGLVTDTAPAGAYKTLVKLVRSLPFSFRSKGSDVCIYPLPTPTLARVLIQLVENPLAAGTYNVFEQKDSLNNFLTSLERNFPRFRIRLNFHAENIVKMTNRLRRSKIFPKRLADKVLTFLMKEDDYLQKFPSLPHQ